MKNYKKKLAIVISSLEVGGAEKMVLDLIKEIKDYLDVKLFIIKSNKNSIYDVQAKNLGIETKYYNHKIKVFSLLVASRLKTALDKFNPDIIHSHLKASTYVYFYNIFNKKFKWVHTIHTVAYIDTKIIRRFFFKPLYNKNRINLIAVSKTAKLSAQNLYKNSNIKVINNGINLSKFKPIPNNGSLNLINVGRLEQVKNHDYLLTEVSKTVNFTNINKLYLIGDGKRKNHITNLINKLKLGSIVEVISYTNKVNEYLNMADIFILTSHYEGMPLAVIEAMASGLIIIATKAAGDVIENNYNGFIIDLKEDSLYKKLKEVITNIKDLGFIRENAISSSKNFSIKKMAEQYLEIYLED